MTHTTALEKPQFIAQTRVGQPVPNLQFEIYHSNKIEKKRIADYKGQWLIVFFYPADFTFVCPTELEELAESYEAIKGLGAEVVSVSSDTVYAHKAWHDSSPAIKKIRFPMAGDPAGRLAKAFGTYIECEGLECVDDEGLSLRGTFLIDPDGVLRTAEIHDNAIGRSAKELIRKLKAAQFVRTHGGKVCPASWDEGDDVLAPGLDLVGKI